MRRSTIPERGCERLGRQRDRGEEGVVSGGQLAERASVGIEQDAVRGQDLELAGLGVDDHHHDPVGRQLTRRGLGPPRIGPHLGLVGEGGLVPMMSIGNEERLASEGREQALVRLDGRQLVDQPVAVARPPLVAQRRAATGSSARAVEVNGQDRAELRPRRAEQREPIGLRSRHGVLVWADPVAPRLEEDADHDPVNRRLVGRGRRRVPIRVERRLHPPL